MFRFFIKVSDSERVVYQWGGSAWTMDIDARIRQQLFSYYDTVVIDYAPSGEWSSHATREEDIILWPDFDQLTDDQIRYAIITYHGRYGSLLEEFITPVNSLQYGT